MNEAMTTGLEGALLEAVESHAGGGQNGGGAATGDLLGLAMKVLPQLLENSKEREDIVEQQKVGVTVLQKEVRMLRRQMRDYVQTQKGILEELHLMRELQSTMVAHLARVQILEMPEEEKMEDEFDELDDEYNFAEDLIAHHGQRAGISAGTNASKLNGRRKRHLR